MLRPRRGHVSLATIPTTATFLVGFLGSFRRDSGVSLWTSGRRAGLPPKKGKARSHRLGSLARLVILQWAYVRYFSNLQVNTYFYITELYYLISLSL